MTIGRRLYWLRMGLLKRTCRMDKTEELDARLFSPLFGESLTLHSLNIWECSECGRTHEEVLGEYEYCPHCGRKVVVE